MIVLLLLQAHWGLRDSTIKQWENELGNQCKLMGEDNGSILYKYAAKTLLKDKPIDLFNELIPIIIQMHS